MRKGVLATLLCAGGLSLAGGWIGWMRVGLQALQIGPGACG